MKFLWSNYGNLWSFYWNLWSFYGDLVGFYGVIMEIYGVFMEFWANHTKLLQCMGGLIAVHRSPGKKAHMMGVHKNRKKYDFIFFFFFSFFFLVWSMHYSFLWLTEGMGSVLFPIVSCFFLENACRWLILASIYLSEMYTFWITDFWSID